MSLISDKKKIFNDLRIPWNSSIKDEFKKEMTAHPDQDPELVLSKICKPYMQYAFEHEAETYHAWLKAKYGDHATGKAIKAAIGEEGLTLLIKAGLIRKIPKEKRYIING